MNSEQIIAVLANGLAKQDGLFSKKITKAKIQKMLTTMIEEFEKTVTTHKSYDKVEWRTFQKQYYASLPELEDDRSLYFDIDTRSCGPITAKWFADEEHQICSKNNYQLFEWVIKKMNEPIEKVVEEEQTTLKKKDYKLGMMIGQTVKGAVLKYEVVGLEPRHVILQPFVEPKEKRRFIYSNPSLHIIEEESETNEDASTIVCFSGKLSMVRKDAEALVMAKGGIVKKSVTKDVTHLVVGGNDKTSKKCQEAEKKGVTLLTEDEFMEMFD